MAVAVKVEIGAALVKTKFPLVVGKEIVLANVAPDIGPMDVLSPDPPKDWETVPNMMVPEVVVPVLIT
jgi:hypothetical protein